MSPAGTFMQFISAIICLPLPLRMSYSQSPRVHTSRSQQSMFDPSLSLQYGRRDVVCTLYRLTHTTIDAICRPCQDQDICTQEIRMGKVVPISALPSSLISREVQIAALCLHFSPDSIFGVGKLASEISCEGEAKIEVMPRRRISVGKLLQKCASVRTKGARKWGFYQFNLDNCAL